MTEKVVPLIRPPTPTRSAVRTILLEPAHDKRVVELAAEWGMTPNEAAARLIAVYIQAEQDA